MTDTEATNPPPNLKTFVIPIHSWIESSQTSHGVRHEDFKQYQAYCTRRLSRLRHAQAVKKDMVHSIKYVKGKQVRQHVYCSRSRRPEEAGIHHENFLWVPLVQAERAWAEASSSTGKPQQSRRKLKRAMQFANELENLAVECADEQTIQEAKAYAGWMQGNYALRRKDWKTACDAYGTAISICHALAQNTADHEDKPQSLELHDLFTTRADHVIQPLWKYCQYELEEGGSTVDLPTSSSTKTTTSATKTKSHTVTIQGKDIAVDNANVRMLLLKVESLKSEGNRDGNQFVELLSAYDDAIRLVKDDWKSYETTKAGPAVNAKKQELEVLMGYVQEEKLRLLLDRNEAMIQDLTGHAEIVHVYDAVLQDAQTMAAIDRVDDEEFTLQAQANVLRIRALRCFALGQFYADSCTPPSPNKALALYQHADALAHRAMEEIAACDDMEHSDKYLEALEQLATRDIVGATCRAKAQLFLANRGKNATNAAKSDRPLLECLDDYVDCREKLVEDLKPLPIPCKPTFFDLAFDQVTEFPLQELQDLMEQHKPKEKGFLSSWFG